jgi:hypothetical protein
MEARLKQEAEVVFNACRPGMRVSCKMTADETRDKDNRGNVR